MDCVLREDKSFRAEGHSAREDNSLRESNLAGCILKYLIRMPLPLTARASDVPKAIAPGAALD